MKDVCSLCDPFNCICVCAKCDEAADTERDVNGEVVSLCSECASKAEKRGAIVTLGIIQ